ncbi:sigma 54-interacting transcriptional regulator [Neptunicoccus cionae]|uniref:sigma 54-interacting transcriptional regulator n=1 Tax=Neptunicoccus cionae TaxID=2035344 RepID=UPI0015E0CBF0|nr:sigma 54-interacting transcriptional regulator [Amylibacter cionae]
MDGTVLVADDDRTIRTVLTQALTRAGCKVRATSNTATLWRWVEEGEGDAVVSDVMMPDGNGLDLLPAIMKRRPNLPVIVISAQNTVVTAIRASEAGAFDYVPKPFDLRDLLSKVSKALSRPGHANQPEPIKQDTLVAADPALPLVGGSPAMQEVYRIVARVVNTDLNVLVQGESGTGKDLLARALHNLGNRAQAGYVRINCGTATPEQLDHAVLGDAGQGGTVYLDEVSELSPESQLHLLGLTQSDAVQAQGLRFVSSTNRPMLPLINDGLFREDLFYRLNVMPIVLPPLRDRIEDIPELSQHFLQVCASKGMPRKTLTKSAMDQMRLAKWPGNVRGLQNFIQRLVILCPEDEISSDFVSKALKEMAEQEQSGTPVVADRLSASVEAHIKRYFDLHGDALPPPGLYNRILREVELPLLALSLSATRGNQIRTAELLGINRNTLRKKIRELDIQVTRTKKLT